MADRATGAGPAAPASRAAREAGPRSGREPRSALQAEQLDIEDQRGVWRDRAASAARAIAETGRDDERALATNLHARHALVPTLDDPALADRKLERLVAIDRGVEFLALGAVLVEPAGVMHDHGLARARRRAGAGLGVDDLEAGRCGDGFCGRL